AGLLLPYSNALDTSDHLLLVVLDGGLTVTCLDKTSTADCSRETVSSLTSANMPIGFGAAFDDDADESSFLVSGAAARLAPSLLIARPTFFSDPTYASTLPPTAASTTREKSAGAAVSSRLAARRRRSSARTPRTWSLAAARPSLATPQRSSSVTDASSSASTSRRWRGRRSASQLLGSRTASSTYSYRSPSSPSHARTVCGDGEVADGEVAQDRSLCRSCSTLRTRVCGRVGRLMDRRWVAIVWNRNACLQQDRRQWSYGFYPRAMETRDPLLAVDVYPLSRPILFHGAYPLYTAMADAYSLPVDRLTRYATLGYERTSSASGMLLPVVTACNGFILGLSFCLILASFASEDPFPQPIHLEQLHPAKCEVKSAFEAECSVA
ncbi:hypothetical protein EJB05_43805, partial [Eragrostis curvula]